MKKVRSLFLAYSVLICAASVFGQATSFLPDHPVKKALTDYDTAWNSKNVDGMSRVLADDYVYFSSTGGLTDRAATLKFLVSPDYKLTFVERSEVKLLSQKNNVAVVSSRWKGRGTYGKEEINDDQRCGLVFVKQGRTWKLLSEHCAQIVSK